jgi:hypothetical protein
MLSRQRNGAFGKFYIKGFFRESVSPQPQSIPLGPFQIFSKIRGDIRKPRCTAGVNDTGCAPNLPPVSLTPVATLPPVSTTLAKLVEKFTSVIDTSGKFSTGVVDTGGAPWLANISANFRENLKWS